MRQPAAAARSHHSWESGSAAMPALLGPGLLVQSEPCGFLGSVQSGCRVGCERRWGLSTTTKRSGPAPRLFRWWNCAQLEHSTPGQLQVREIPTASQVRLSAPKLMLRRTYRRGRPRPDCCVGSRAARRSVICSGVMASRSRSSARRTTELRLMTFRPPRRTFAYSHSLSHKSFRLSSHTWRGSSGTATSCSGAGGLAFFWPAGVPTAAAGFGDAAAASESMRTGAATTTGPNTGEGSCVSASPLPSTAVRSIT